jgi:hypothetical protein
MAKGRRPSNRIDHNLITGAASPTPAHLGLHEPRLQ